MMKLSCLHVMLGERPLSEAFSMVRDAGFDGIDLRGDLAAGAEDDIRSLSEQTGLRVPTVYGRITVPLLSATLPERAESMELVRTRLRTAQAIGADNVIVVPIFGEPRITADIGDGVAATEIAVLFTLLAELAPEAEAAGVRLVLEPLNRKETHLLTSPTATAELTRRFGSPWVQTMIDTYHTDLESQDPAVEFADAGDQVALLHLSDRNRSLPGEGGVDFAPLLHAADVADFGGWMGLECAGPYDVEQLSGCVDWLRSQVPTANSQ